MQKTLQMKKFTTSILSFALALSVVAPVAASAQMTTPFTSNLTVGSTGPAVVSLQSFLVAKGLLTMPAGVSMGYFGGLTKAAVSAYQMSKGILPAAGYFGPITMGYVNADMSGMSNGGTTGGTTTSTPGCPAGALFNSMTGASCSSTTTTTTNSGVEGSVDVRLAATPTDNANIRTSTDVPVYGLEFRARIADVSVQTVDMEVSVINTGNNNASENPSTLINTIKVWDGSNVIATVPVNSTTFTRDQSQVYYIRIPNLNFNVPKDATKVLTFSFSTNSLDSTRNVTIDGYGLNSIRAVSGNGISAFYSANGLTRTHSFLKPGNSTLTLSAPATTLRSQNYRVNGTDALQGVVLGQFSVKSQSGDSTLLTVNASTTASGTNPTTLYLYQGSTLMKSKSVSGTVGQTISTSFDNLDTVPANVVTGNDTPVTYTITADFPSNTTNGSFASTTVNSVAYFNPNGNTATVSGTVSNVNQYVYTKAALIKLASAPTITVNNQTVAGVGTTTMVATFPLTIQALGGDVVLPANGDFQVVFSNGTNYTATSTSAGASISAVTIPNNTIADGSVANVTVTASCNGTCATTNGLFNAALSQIKWNAGNGVVTQTYGLDDFKTASAVTFTR
jgi:hypothetical protein